MEFLELKPGWVIRVPLGMTMLTGAPDMMKLAHWRFDPVTLLLVAGVGLGVAGAIQQQGAGEQEVEAIEQASRISDAQAQFDNEIALANKEELDRQAQAELDAGEIESSRVARKEKFIRAAQRAAFGKTGIGIAGASLSVLTDTARQFALDRNLVLRNALLRSRSLLFRGQIQLAQGEFALSQGKAKKQASFISAEAAKLSSRAQLLSTGSSILSTFGKK